MNQAESACAYLPTRTGLVAQWNVRRSVEGLSVLTEPAVSHGAYCRCEDVIATGSAALHGLISLGAATCYRSCCRLSATDLSLPR